MRLENLIGGSLAAAAAGGLVLATPATASDRDRDRARAAIAGIAIAAAVAKAKKERDRERRYDRYERDGQYYYHHDWGATFRPEGTKHTICYRRIRQCYHKGQYSSKWTYREFGYYGR